MAVNSILSIATSGLKAGATRAAVIADNLANVRTPGYKASEVRATSLRTGPSPVGGAGVQVQVIAGRAPDIGLEFSRLIQAEKAYKANAAVLRRAEDLERELLSIKV